MKSKKGFTLVEVLAVICILGALVAIAVPSVIFVSNKLKTKMYCTKLETIESSAKLYGQDNASQLVTPCTVRGVQYQKCITKTIGSLIPLYVESDKGNENIALDPRDKTSINEKNVYIYEKNNGRIYSTIIDEECD